MSLHDTNTSSIVTWQNGQSRTIIVCCSDTPTDRHFSDNVRKRLSCAVEHEDTTTGEVSWRESTLSVSQSFIKCLSEIGPDTGHMQVAVTRHGEGTATVYTMRRLRSEVATDKPGTASTARPDDGKTRKAPSNASKTAWLG